jgi:two-component system response regulator
VKHILLVLGNRDAEMMTRRTLALNNIPNDVCVARGGDEALRMLFTDRSAALPGLVLLDMNLPRAEGLEVVVGIRADVRTWLLPVALLTTSSEQAGVLAARSGGASAYAREPLMFTDVAETMEVLGMPWLLISELPPGRRPWRVRAARPRHATLSHFVST